MRITTGIIRMGSHRSWLVVLSIGIACGISTRLLAADPAPEPPAPPVLHLANGSFASGKLEEGPKAGVLRWLATPFVSAFEFPLDAVNAIHWPPPAAPPKPATDYCFELAAGDVLFGSLLGLDEKKAELDVPSIGHIEISRAQINRIYRWRDSADLIYLGPNGLNGWTETAAPRPVQPNAIRRGVRIINGVIQNAPAVVEKRADAEAPPKNWREESGQLVTDIEGASIGGDFDLPARASIEFEISWKTKPDFVFAFGVNDSDRVLSSKRAFRFEAWGGDLVVQRELEHEADLAVVQELPPGPGRAHLNIFLDQEKGRILVFSQAGKRLADLKVANPIPAILPGIYLANTRGDIRLEWLRIGRWSGELPREVKADQARIHRSDGTIEYGNVTHFDAAAKSFVVRGDSGEARIEQDKMTSVFLSAPSEEPPRAIRAVYQDGARLSGDLEKVEKGSVWLKVPGVAQTLGLPVHGLRSLVVIRHGENRDPIINDKVSGRLEIDGLRLPGQLVDGRADAHASCLVWQPTGSTIASALRPGLAGRIVYKEPKPSTPSPFATSGGVEFPRIVQRVAPVQGAQPARRGGMAVQFAEALGDNAGKTSTRSGREPRSLYLRDGDVIPCTITSIDEKGVWFRTSTSTSTFVAHDKVKAIELAPEQPSAPTVRLTKSKLDRLLTLPRMQKPAPPTQLIRSNNGDYLRGKVVKMDENTLQVEIHLETKDVPRDRISRIIWLHADEFEPVRKPIPPSPDGHSRVQALRNDGIRLTFLAQQFANQSLSGTSEVLGPCNVAVKEMDQLLIGGAIEVAAAQLAYQQWKLKNAPEPKYVTAEDSAGSGGNDTGMESPLVGKPAPDFSLDLLDGKKFHLADNKGKIVVLDFWATWCGPCLQAMPQVERAADQFKDKGVRLVAVNLQESPDQIRSMLERHKLHMTIALDKSGKVAENYKAVAIPQTVIIGPEGNVARLFVGGGPKFEEVLKEAIQNVLAGDKLKESKKD